MVDPARAIDTSRMRGDFQRHEREVIARAGRITALIGTILIPLFIPIDFLTQPREVFPALLGARVAACVALIFIYRSFASSFGANNPSSLVLAIALVPTAMVFFMMHLSGWHDSSYFIALIILLLAVSILARWSPAWSAVHGIATITLYAVLTLALDLTRVVAFVENTFSLIGTSLLAILASSLSKRLHQSEFENQWSVLEANRHKSEFFANVSHELRTPIHVIIGYIDMLLDRDKSWESSDGRDLLNNIRSQGLTLHTLVSDLLDSAKLEAGKMEVQRAELSLADLVEQTAANFRPWIAEKGLRFSVSHTPGPHNIVSDGNKIRQILTNLLSNAFKFTNSGSIEIAIRETQSLNHGELSGLVALTGMHSRAVHRRNLPSTGLALMITDTGIGMDPSALDNLAKDYSQPMEPDAAVYGGTGLGLSLSRKLATLLGGVIAVRTERGVGSTFALFLPRTFEQKAAGRTEESPRSHAEPRDQARLAS